MRQTVSFFIMLATVFSMSGSLRWLSTSYDFGTMKEIAGPKEGSVRFVNQGPDEVVILDMRPSCGCTSVEYPDTPIAAGDTATVKFTYDPAGRPGKFQKTIRVTTSGDNGVSIIRITGNVLGTPESLSKLYPDESGPLRFTSKMVYGGELKHGKTRNDFFTVYNQSPDTIIPAFRSDDPTLSIESTDLRLGPGDTATFSLFYNSRDDNRYGPSEIPFEIVTDTTKKDAETAKCSYHVNVIPDFPNLSREEIENAPKLQMAVDRVNAGTIEKGVENQPVALTVENKGKKPLTLLRVYSYYPEIKITDYPSQIKPGKTGEIKFEIISDKLQGGLFQTQFKILSDDPSQPSTDVNIYGMKD